MKTERIKIGDIVKKTGSTTDYTVGRRGQVIEIDAVKQRARVMWTHHPAFEQVEGQYTYNRTGEYYRVDKPTRTWVNFRYLSDPIVTNSIESSQS